MNYAERLEKVSVLGAAGKMGSGILLLTALEMADLSLKPENRNRIFLLNAIDVSDANLKGLMRYIEAQVLKTAEKKIVALRHLYADQAQLIENGQVIEQYVKDVMRIIRPTNRLEAAFDSYLIFEAVSENRTLKNELLSTIWKNNPHKPYFLTNTSSIPIAEIDAEAGLEGHIIGYHFYNPPAIQKLLEIIPSAHSLPEMETFGLELARNMRKIVVKSNDKAGFIGNGHFMRDALHGIAEAQRLAAEVPFVEAIYMMNRVSQDFLVRPMGIFQLIDYVGIDVVQFILRVMNPYYLNEDLHSGLLDEFMNMGIRGGQNPDGSQKEGFFRYEKGKPSEVFDPETRSYISIQPFQAQVDERLGMMPASFMPWKAAMKDGRREENLRIFFQELSHKKTLGANLAIRYGQQSDAIGRKLVAEGVALSEADVNTVLTTGFFHSYGPINTFFQTTN